MSRNNLTLNERIELYKFVVTVAFSAGVALFCMSQLSGQSNSDRRNDSAYFGLLGSCVALWVNPNPSGAKKESTNVAVDSQQTTILARPREIQE
ncbi:hypothetical protein [Chroococcidiopsis sp.]|uniref:hypothetical protein n=1 Tax=Chroococcidiopsis sp. TaxID=3088168 RepID=UPI003F343EB9